jgi:hypothetical protein
MADGWDEVALLYFVMLGGNFFPIVIIASLFVILAGFSFLKLQRWARMGLSIFTWIAAGYLGVCWFTWLRDWIHRQELLWTIALWSGCFAVPIAFFLLLFVGLWTNTVRKIFA